MNKRTRESVSACAALGLHYWSDHPTNGAVWAIDDQQQAREVRIHRDAGIAHVGLDCQRNRLSVCLANNAVRFTTVNANEWQAFTQNGEDMSVNRFAGTCSVCSSYVPARAGNLRKAGRTWLVTHLACSDGTPRVIEARFNSGAVVIQNLRGRCIDAPCCGCCTY